VFKVPGCVYDDTTIGDALHEAPPSLEYLSSAPEEVFQTTNTVPFLFTTIFGPGFAPWLPDIITIGPSHEVPLLVLLHKSTPPLVAKFTYAI
jgi:hypothetical protein